MLRVSQKHVTEIILPTNSTHFLVVLLDTQLMIQNACRKIITFLPNWMQTIIERYWETLSIVSWQQILHFSFRTRQILRTFSRTGTSRGNRKVTGNYYSFYRLDSDVYYIEPPRKRKTSSCYIITCSIFSFHIKLRLDYKFNR